jgi:hypothetical protein
MFILAGLYSYILYKERGSNIFLLLTLIFQILACLSDWPGYYMAALIFVFEILVPIGRRRWGLIIALLVLNIVIFASYIGLLLLADASGYLVNRLLGLSKYWGLEKQTFSLLTYSWTELRRIVIYFSAVVVALSLIPVIRLITSSRRKTDLFCISMLVISADLLIFRHICYVHDYYIYYLNVFTAVSAAVGLQKIMEIFRDKRVLMVMAAVIILVMFLLQSGMVLYKRKTFVGVNEYMYRLSTTINKHTPEDANIIVPLRFHTNSAGFYTQRFIAFYHPDEHIFGTEYTAPLLRDVTFEKFLQIAEGYKRPTYIVTTTSEEIVRHINHFSGLIENRVVLEDILSYWKIPDKADRFFNMLIHRYPYKLYNGFYFFEVTD